MTIAIPEAVVAAVVVVGTFLAVAAFVLRLGQAWIDAAPDAMPRDWWQR